MRIVVDNNKIETCQKFTYQVISHEIYFNYCKTVKQIVRSEWKYIFHADLCYQSIERDRSSIILLSKQVSQLWVMGVYPTNFLFNNHNIILN